jgi:regulator of sigma E protease
MSVLVGVIIGLFMLMCLVTAHEFGHFLMARKNGVEVEEFGICFPPRAICWRKVKGKWTRIPKKQWDKMPGEGLILSLNWLPIGGFCQMKGESAADKTKGSFGAASYWRKTKILFGGVLANWLVAFVILTVLAWTGMPHFLGNQFTIESDTKAISVQPVAISEVLKDSPAEKAGFKEGDILKHASYEEADCGTEPCLKAEEIDIYTPDDFISANNRYPGQTVKVIYEREGEERTAEVALNNADADYLFGASIGGSALYRNTWSAPVVGFGTMMQITGETFKGVGTLLVNFFSGIVKQVNFDASVRQDGAEELKSASDSVRSPVGIVGVLFPAFTSSGAPYLFFLVALISISLACMNVLPIPALDGGRWMLITIYKLLKKKLTKETEEKIVSRAFTVIIVLALVVTVLDILRLAGR